MKAALVQTSIAWEDKPANFASVRKLLVDTTFPEGGLIVLPELFAAGFTMNAEGVAEEDLGDTEQFLVELAREKSAHVIGGVAKTKSPPLKPANCAVIASPDGEILCRAEKTHLFTLGGEHESYSQGNRIRSVELLGTRVSPSVCYDLRFPEVFRVGASSGAEILVVIANWPAVRVQHWLTLLQARAIENQACVIGVNRSGTDPYHDYPGRSIAVDYMGEIIADAGSEACVVEAEFDLARLREWREKFPALRDMHDSLAD